MNGLCTPEKTAVRLHVISDLHLESGPYRVPEDLECDVIIAAGDIGEGTAGVEFLQTLDRHVVYVPGNHEYYSRKEPADMAERLADIRRAAADSNVHVLDNDSVVIDGTRFLGATLWTNFGNAHPGLLREALGTQNDYLRIGARSWYDSLENRQSLKNELNAVWNDRHWNQSMLRQRRFHPLIALALHRQSVAWLDRRLSEPFDGPTVVVTHHHPHFESLIRTGTSQELIEDRELWYRRALSDDLPRYRIASYASDLSYLLRQHREAINLWVAGHIHSHLDYVRHRVRIVCNPRGVPLPISDKVSAPSHHHSRVRGFNPRFVVDLNDGIRPAVEREIDAVRLRLEQLHLESEQLAPHIGEHQGIVRQAIREAFATRTQTFESVFDRLLQSIAESIDYRTVYQFRHKALLTELGLPGLTSPLSYDAVDIPNLPSQRSEPEYVAGCVAGQKQCLETMKELSGKVKDYCREGRRLCGGPNFDRLDAFLETARPMPAALVERVKQLTLNVEVNLDERLPPESNEP